MNTITVFFVVTTLIVAACGQQGASSSPGRWGDPANSVDLGTGSIAIYTGDQSYRCVGRLLCGGKPKKGVLVKLMDEDDGKRSSSLYGFNGNSMEDMYNRLFRSQSGRHDPARLHGRRRSLRIEGHAKRIDHDRPGAQDLPQLQ